MGNPILIDADFGNPEVAGRLNATIGADEKNGGQGLE
jgi:hypothetical protein